MKKLSNKILLLIVLCMGVGFSYLTSGLVIRGNTEVSGNSWDIYFQNIQVLEGSVSSPLPTIDTNKTKVNFAVELVKPGDYYSFTVDAVNNGTIDAMIDSLIKSNFDENISKLFDYSVTYLDGEEIRKDDLLEAKTTTTYKVFVQYKKDISPSDLSSSDIDLNLSFEANYVMADDSINRITFGQVWDFDYSGSENIFNVPYDGEYKLEVWGAQGGYSNDSQPGGYGGYAIGTINLNSNDTLYINVGEKGKATSTASSISTGDAYNGGGAGHGNSDKKGTSGGGATHIALKTGVLSSLKSDTNDILIVAGGGGGSITTHSTKYGYGGSAGGYIGNKGTTTLTEFKIGSGGSQIAGGDGWNEIGIGSFGQGGINPSNGAGGGGGYYGGGAGQYDCGAGGGSGYIGNIHLYDKSMYCYNCSTSSEESTKTITTTNVSNSAISNYAKSGNGYARITYLGNANIYLMDFKKSTGSVNVNNIQLNSITGQISFETSLSNTTDYAEFSFTINNASDKNYYISKLLKSNYDNTKMEFEVTHEDGEKVSTKDYIKSNSTEKINVKIKLLDNSISLNNELLTLTINLYEAKNNVTYNRISWLYNYEGKEETFTTPKSGTYKLEVWGAQGGYGSSTTYRGGYGGYSIGYIDLEKNTTLYVNVGGKGINGTTKTTAKKDGGYNGGGSSAGTTSKYVGSGGGATHIALESGLLATFQSKQNKILIVAGAGGGGGYESSSYSSTGGNGGGYQGTASSCNNSSYTTGKGGTQTAGGTGVLTASFGQGGNGTSDAMGGGGGFYGGGAGQYTSGGGGGSGYIENTSLTNKAMYCYNCTTSDVESTKTISTTSVSETPISQYAKIGDGYAKITYLGE